MTMLELFVVYPALMLWWAVVLGACVALLRAVIAGKKPEPVKPIGPDLRTMQDDKALRPSIWKRES